MGYGNSSQVIDPWNPDSWGSSQSGLGGFMEGFGQVGQGLTGLASMFNAYNQNKLMKNKVALAGANFNAQRENAMFNANNANSLAAQLYGNSVGSTGYNDYQKTHALNLPNSPV